MKTSDATLRRLQGIVDDVADSYSGGRAIDSLETTALPNRRKIVEALGQLEHVAYMGFYSTRSLGTLNLRQHIGELLHQAAETLIEQIARAVGYGTCRGEPTERDIQWSEGVVMDTFARIPDIRELLSLDAQAAFDGDPAAKSIEEVVFSYPAVHAITIYRFAHELYQREVPLVPRIMAEHAHSETGIELHPGARIGKRFFIDHGTGVVVGETAVIGDDVKLYQGVTLGALSLPRDEAGDVIREAQRHPTIEDDVTIYAGATILGGNTVIGRGAVIGSNTWITHSVPPGTRVTFVASTGAGTPGTQHMDSSHPPPARRTRAR